MNDIPSNLKNIHGLFKEKQKTGFEGAHVQYEGGNEHHDYFRRLPFLRLKKLLKKADIELNNAKLHVASCGCGIDIHYLSKICNPRIFASDYSKEAIERVRKTFPAVQAQVEDNEHLSFADNFFDWSFIAASLHHLPRPLLGLYELLRVSKQGVIVIEPNNSLLTRLAARIGVAQEYEASGNYVYRISKGDVHKIARSGYCDYFVDRCFAPHRVAKSHIEFVILKTLAGFCNTITAPLGNCIIFIIKKHADTIV